MWDACFAFTKPLISDWPTTNAMKMKRFEHFDRIIINISLFFSHFVLLFTFFGIWKCIFVKIVSPSRDIESVTCFAYLSLIRGATQCVFFFSSFFVLMCMVWFGCSLPTEHNGSADDLLIFRQSTAFSY